MFRQAAKIFRSVAGVLKKESQVLPRVYAHTGIHPAPLHFQVNSFSTARAAPPQQSSLVAMWREQLQASLNNRPTLLGNWQQRSLLSSMVEGLRSNPGRVTVGGASGLSSAAFLFQVSDPTVLHSTQISPAEAALHKTPADESALFSGFETPAFPTDAPHSRPDAAAQSLNSIGLSAVHSLVSFPAFLYGLNSKLLVAQNQLQEENIKALEEEVQQVSAELEQERAKNAALQAEVWHLEEKNEVLLNRVSDTSRLCIACCENERNVVYGCRHVALCETCDQAWEKKHGDCPFCRKSIDFRMAFHLN